MQAPPSAIILHNVSLSSTSLPLGCHHPKVTRRCLTQTYKNLYIEAWRTSPSRGSAAPWPPCAPSPPMRGGTRASSSGASNKVSIRTTETDALHWSGRPGDPDSYGPGTPGFYIATFAEAVYVLHAFEKRTRKTPKHDLELAQDRLRALVNRRRTDAGQK